MALNTAEILKHLIRTISENKEKLTDQAVEKIALELENNFSSQRGNMRSTLMLLDLQATIHSRTTHLG